jgi:cell division protease FtsH
MALLTVLFVLLLRTTGRSAGAQAIGFGRSKAKLVPEKGTGVTFEDVAGCDEAKAELREMVAFLKDPKRFTALGARIPKGVLLLGPPGTGKTLLARAMAGEAGVPFFSINGSDFVEMFVGVGAARVRDLFDQAKAKAPCIVFVDEVDAVGRQRGVSMGVVNDEREQTLNQLLSEMDGFEANSGVILLAATNRPEILDRALLRAGRFDRQVVLDSPDRTGREAILRVHARGKALAPDVDLSRIAQSTPGMSGADLANALNEAALAAAQAGGKEIHQVDVEQAIERVVAGPERRSRRLGADEKRRVAYHESGHAIVAAHCEHADPIRKISIVPRGRAALGYTLMLPEEDQLLRTREQLQDRLTVLLGGRAAEILRLGGPSTGAQDDLETATALARQMVTMFGMSERVGLPCWARPADGRFLPVEGALQRDCSEATAREIDEEVRRLLDEAYERARDLLVGHVEELERVARELLERETLDRGRFDELLADSACVPETDHRNASVSA